jgi:hypothetical protein
MELSLGCIVLPKNTIPHIFMHITKAIRLLIDINTCELKDGGLPSKQKKLVLAWAELHKEELLADWELASNGELPFKIDPLK